MTTRDTHWHHHIVCAPPQSCGPSKKKCSFFLVMASWTFPTHKKKDLRCYSTVKESRKRTPHLQTPPWTVENSNTLQCDGPWVSGQFRESFKVPFVSQERYTAQSQSPRQKLHLPQLPPSSRPDIAAVSAEASRGTYPRSPWLEVTSESRSCVQVMVILPK